ncbi:unnamed protein product, partial [Allacma fusca]
IRFKTVIRKLRKFNFVIHFGGCFFHAKIKNKLYKDPNACGKYRTLEMQKL